MLKFPILLLPFVIMTAFNALGQQQALPLSIDPKPVLVSSQFKFTEGPAADREGNVFFTDQPNNKIWKYSTDGKLSVFLDSAGRSNGLYFDRKGNLISCADENNQLWQINPQGKVTVLLDGMMGHRLNGPNDCWIDRSNGIFFTDPYYQRNYWTRKKPDEAIGGEKLYYLPAGKKEAVVVDGALKKPNGIVGSKDGKFLFVSDIGAKIIYKYRISKKGQLQDRQVFANDMADGMTMDHLGNLYLAGKGVTVYNSKGQQINHYDVPSGWTANICFGGAQKNILFITASESVYTMRMNVKGIH